MRLRLRLMRVSPLTTAPLSSSGFERNVRGGGRKDTARDFQNFRRTAHGIGKIARNIGKRGQKEISEAVALEPASGLEAILKEPGKQRAVVGKGHHAIADIAGRKHIELAPQPPGTASVVGHGHDGGDIDKRLVRSLSACAADGCTS